MSDDDLTTLRLRIEGSVQGIGYRFFATEEARKLGLHGWIRNRSDGAVEALVSGPTKSVLRRGVHARTDWRARHQCRYAWGRTACRTRLPLSANGLGNSQGPRPSGPPINSETVRQ